MGPTSVFTSCRDTVGKTDASLNTATKPSTPSTIVEDGIGDGARTATGAGAGAFRFRAGAGGGMGWPDAAAAAAT